MPVQLCEQSLVVVLPLASGYPRGKLLDIFQCLDVALMVGVPHGATVFELREYSRAVQLSTNLWRCLMELTVDEA